MKLSYAIIRKRRRGYRRKGILWDYNNDGQYFNEHLGSKEKRYWRKWRKKQGKNILNQ